VRVEEYAYYVNKLRLKTRIWRQTVTSQKAHTKCKCPPSATEWNPPWKLSAYATVRSNRYLGCSSTFKWLCLCDRKVPGKGPSYCEQLPLSNRYDCFQQKSAKLLLVPEKHQ